MYQQDAMHVKFWDDELVTVYLSVIQKLVDAVSDGVMSLKLEIAFLFFVLPFAVSTSTQTYLAPC